METLTFRLEPGSGRVAQRIPDGVRVDDGLRWLAPVWDPEHGLRLDHLGDTDVASWHQGSLTMPPGSWMQPGHVRANPEHARLAIQLPREQPTAGQWWLTWWFEAGESMTVELIPHGQMRDWPPVYGSLKGF